MKKEILFFGLVLILFVSLVSATNVNHQCSDCGNGLFNFCDKKECLSLGNCEYDSASDCVSKDMPKYEEINHQCSDCGKGFFNFCDKEECLSFGDCKYKSKLFGVECIDKIITIPDTLPRGNYQEDSRNLQEDYEEDFWDEYINNNSLNYENNTYNLNEIGGDYCFDSDVSEFCSDGKNYYLFGEVSYGGISLPDSCTGNILSESFCTGNSDSPVGVKSYSCSGKCLNGTCVEEVNEQCYDDTLNYQCSSNKPEYCFHGILVNNCSFCGCNEGMICQHNICIDAPIPGQCSDKTLNGQCSSNKPYYCNNGKLIEDCFKCGCKNGYYCKEFERGYPTPLGEKEFKWAYKPLGSCVKINCIDGTPYGQCASKISLRLIPSQDIVNNYALQYLYCGDNNVKKYSGNKEHGILTFPGQLQTNCSICGCPYKSQICEEYSGICRGCKDGTPWRECSSTKPLFCNGDNELEEECSLCGGCPEGQTCRSDGHCADLSDPKRSLDCYPNLKNGECYFVGADVFQCIEGGIAASSACLNCGCPEGMYCKKERGCITQYSCEWKEELKPTKEKPCVEVLDGHLSESEQIYKRGFTWYFNPPYDYTHNNNRPREKIGDGCYSETILYESVCTDKKTYEGYKQIDGKYDPDFYKRVVCNNGCFEGKCFPEPETPPKTYSLSNIKIINGNFEMGKFDFDGAFYPKQGWSIKKDEYQFYTRRSNPRELVEISDKIVHTGKYSLRFKHDPLTESTKTSIIRQKINLDSSFYDKKLQVSAYVYADTYDYVTMRVFFKKADGKFVGGTNYKGPVKSSYKKRWQKISLDIPITSSSTDYIILEFKPARIYPSTLQTPYSGGNGDSNGAYIDDVEIKVI